MRSSRRIPSAFSIASRLSLPGLIFSALAALPARSAGSEESGGNWPQWRGPGRDGISRETGLLPSWPAGGPKLLWRSGGAGEGYSTVSIAGGRIFTMGNRGGEEYVIAYDEKTGKELWAAKNGPAFRNGRGNGPRGTPTVDGELLYALGGRGRLVCLEAATGKERWGRDLLSEFSARNIQWGISESPLLLEDRILATPGGSDASIVALGKENGETIWKCPGDRAAYSSGIIADLDGAPQVIFFTESAAVGLDPRSGSLYWRYDRASNGTANVATPIYRDGRVFISSDYGTGCALLRLEKAGGGIRAREVYFNRDMRNHHSSSILVGDHLYGYSSGVLTCMEFQTGSVAWKDRSVGKGSLVFAEGRLYCLSEDGVVGLVEATPAVYREVGRFKIPHGGRPTWAHPVVAGGRLYLRDQDTLHCFDIRRTHEASLETDP